MYLCLLISAPFTNMFYAVKPMEIKNITHLKILYIELTSSLTSDLSIWSLQAFNWFYLFSIFETVNMWGNFYQRKISSKFLGTV